MHQFYLAFGANGGSVLYAYLAAVLLENGFVTNATQIKF
jgi:hypothetical protein